LGSVLIPSVAAMSCETVRSAKMAHFMAHVVK